MAFFCPQREQSKIKKIKGKNKMLMKKRERFKMNTQKKLVVGFLRIVQLIVIFLHFSFFQYSDLHF